MIRISEIFVSISQYLDRTGATFCVTLCASPWCATSGTTTAATSTTWGSSRTCCSSRRSPSSSRCRRTLPPSQNIIETTPPVTLTTFPSLPSLNRRSYLLFKSTHRILQWCLSSSSPSSSCCKPFGYVDPKSCLFLERKYSKGKSFNRVVADTCSGQTSSTG